MTEEIIFIKGHRRLVMILIELWCRPEKRTNYLGKLPEGV
jgi:hypothetical protein